MSYVMSFTGVVNLTDVPENVAVDEARMAESALHRFFGDDNVFVKLYDTDMKNIVSFEKFDEPKRFVRGTQEFEAMMRLLVDALVKNNVIADNVVVVPDGSHEDYIKRFKDYGSIVFMDNVFKKFDKVNDSTVEVSVDYRALFVAFKDVAIDIDTYKNDFQRVVSDVIAQNTLRGVSWK